MPTPLKFTQNQGSTELKLQTTLSCVNSKERDDLCPIENNNYEMNNLNKSKKLKKLEENELSNMLEG